MTLGEIIKRSRLEHNMTQEDLAEALGTTKPTVSRWESNRVYSFKPKMISRISKLLDIEPFYFFQQSYVVTPEEDKLLRAFRTANDSTRAAVAKLLDME